MFLKQKAFPLKCGANKAGKRKLAIQCRNKLNRSPKSSKRAGKE